MLQRNISMVKILISFLADQLSNTVFQVPTEGGG